MTRIQWYGTGGEPHKLARNSISARSYLCVQYCQTYLVDNKWQLVGAWEDLDFFMYCFFVGTWSTTVLTFTVRHDAYIVHKRFSMPCCLLWAIKTVFRTTVWEFAITQWEIFSVREVRQGNEASHHRRHTQQPVFFKWARAYLAQRQWIRGIWKHW